jgi:soluble lytic murein transglycosylase
VAYSLAVYSSRGNQAHYAISFGEPLFKSIPRDFEIKLLPRDVAELIYPAPYRDALDHYCAALGVDPRIVLSLARQESRFNPIAKSNASARGLLQLIPDTAEKLAKEESLDGFRLDDVYNPEIAVRLAARYVADLNKLFAGDPYAIAASYDAGEQSVERWIFRSGSKDTDRFVAEIAIPETKDYVAKVLSNYWAYADLYTQDLRPAF